MSPSKCNHDFVLGICLHCGIPKTDGTGNGVIVIDSNVKAPKAKNKTKDEQRAAAFKDYVYWYQRVYFQEPVNMVTNTEGFISWEVNGVRQAGVSVKRLKQLTGMLKERAKG